MTMKNNNKENKQKLTFRQRMIKTNQDCKMHFDIIKANMKNPVKRAVYGNKVSKTCVSILRGFLLFGLSFIILFPIFQEVIVAIKHPLDLNNPLVVFIPEHFSLVNVQIAGEILNYWKALQCTFKVSLITAILQVASTALAGYAFARLKFKGSEVLFWAIMLTLLIPPQTVALSRDLYFTHFDIFGIIKATTGNTIAINGEGKDIILYLMAILGQGIRASLFIYLFKQTFRGLPIELEESAQIDGAGVGKTFISVMLPNARGTMTTVALFAFVWQWNDAYYVKAYGISGESFPLLTMRLTNVGEWVGNLMKSPQYKHLYFMVGEEVGSNPLFTSAISYTAAFIMMLPLLIGYLFVQRLFIEGVERSGITGM